MATDDQGASPGQKPQQPPAPETQEQATGGAVGTPTAPEADDLLAAMLSGDPAEPATNRQEAPAADEPLASLFDEPAEPRGEPAEPRDEQQAAPGTEQPADSPLPPPRPSLEPRPSPTALPPLKPLTAEERQKLLWIRIVTVNDFFRVLNVFGKADDETREAVIEIGEAFTAMCEGGVMDEAALGRIQDEVSAVEDTLLRIDESIPRDLFLRAVDEGSIPVEQLRRYARLLASRPIPMGPRMDRFDLLATRLLCVKTVSGFHRLLDRRAAKNVLRDMVGGLDSRVTAEDRQQTLATISEAQEKLPEFTSLQAFFESGYYLDAYGYKLTSRKQLVDPEVLYNTVSLNAAILNHLEELRGTSMGRDEVAQKLLQQEGEVRAILVPAAKRKKPKPKASQRPKPRYGKKKPTLLSWDKLANRYPILDKLDPGQVKMAGAILLVVVAGVSLFVSGALGGSGRIGGAGVSNIERKDLKALSPLLLRGIRIEKEGKATLDAKIKRLKWEKLEAKVRARMAESIAHELARQRLDNAKISLFETGATVILISDGSVVAVQGQ